MNRKTLIIFTIALFFINTKTVFAGRGCCSWHGGQSYCGNDGYWYCNDGSRSPSCKCSNTNTSTSNATYQKKIVYGCTDSNALNYNSEATNNDNSCIQKIFGCMDEKAYNYNSNANVKDSSCLYKEYKYEFKKIKYVKKKYNFFTKEGKIIQKGKKGKRKITYQIITNENSEIIEKKEIKKEIINKPSVEIVSTRKKK